MAESEWVWVAIRCPRCKHYRGDAARPLVYVLLPKGQEQAIAHALPMACYGCRWRSEDEAWIIDQAQTPGGAYHKHKPEGSRGDS